MELSDQLNSITLVSSRPRKRKPEHDGLVKTFKINYPFVSDYNQAG